MNIEVLAGLEAARLLKRNPVKYARGVGGMYLLSTKNCEVGQIARASFFFFRNIDDALDGDRADIKNPLNHVLDCREQIADDIYTGKPPIVTLAQFAIEGLRRRSQSTDNPRQDFLDEVDVILFDYHRAKQKRVLNSSELTGYYHDTFYPVVNLMLIGIGSHLRANDIPEFSFCQGRVYSVRDLDADWPRGVINIPAEILEEAQLTPNDSVEKVKSNQVVRNWIIQEMLSCQQELQMLEKKLASAKEGLTTRLCMSLATPLYRLSRKYLDAVSM